VAHDRDDVHADLWVGGIQRLLQTRKAFTGTFQEPLDRARHYPALLALRAMGLIALHTGHDGLLLRLLTEPQFRDRFDNNGRVSRCTPSIDLNALNPEIVNGLPRWNGQRWLYPMSHLVREDLREPLRGWIPHDTDYKRVFDAYEYRSALLIHATHSNVRGSYRVMAGEFLAEGRWNEEDKARAELDFVA
jgi:hypothetical protein